MTDGSIVMINHIAFRENVIVVIGRAFLNRNDIHNYPCASSNLHIYEVRNLSPLQIWPADQICRKDCFTNVSKQSICDTTFT